MCVIIYNYKLLQLCYTVLSIIISSQVHLGAFSYITWASSTVEVSLVVMEL